MEVARNLPLSMRQRRFVAKGEAGNGTIENVVFVGEAAPIAER